MATIRKVIHDKLITDFKALEFDNEDPLFDEVEKFFVDIPDGLACEILDTGGNVDQAGVSFDSRDLEFTAVILESIEASENQSNADVKINRLSNTEDKVLDYLERAPNSITTSLENINVYNIVINNIRTNFLQYETGYKMMKAITFTLKCNINVQAL